MVGKRRGVPPDSHFRALEAARRMYPGKPLFHVWLKKYHLVQPCYVCLPIQIQRLIRKNTLTVKLKIGRTGRTEIETKYKASTGKKYFSIKPLVEYKKFKLGVGDGLVFVMEDLNEERLLLKVCGIDNMKPKLGEFADCDCFADAGHSKERKYRKSGEGTSGLMKVKEEPGSYRKKCGRHIVGLHEDNPILLD
ncbi:uncharacterized protein LOC131017196 [Salvia miltiorrhiza]|uniref:uncharacterized protein LOC131017196 n=1 Tax=Salvia miltiorrhiza TaxID=226208 RepID=UPI0025ABE0F7|nr:uncharacterized protein LOC131017196 [Salvia miltiorrhiza]